MAETDRNRMILDSWIQEKLVNEGWSGVDLSLIHQVLEANGVHLADYDDADAYVADGVRVIGAHLRGEPHVQKRPRGYKSSNALRKAAQRRLRRELTDEEWGQVSPQWEPPYDNADLREILEAIRMEAYASPEGLLDYIEPRWGKRRLEDRVFQLAIRAYATKAIQDLLHGLREKWQIEPGVTESREWYQALEKKQDKDLALVRQEAKSFGATTKKVRKDWFEQRRQADNVFWGHMWCRAAESLLRPDQRRRWLARSAFRDRGDLRETSVGEILKPWAQVLPLDAYERDLGLLAMLLGGDPEGLLWHSFAGALLWRSDEAVPVGIDTVSVWPLPGEGGYPRAVQIIIHTRHISPENLRDPMLWGWIERTIREVWGLYEKPRLRPIDRLRDLFEWATTPIGRLMDRFLAEHRDEEPDKKKILARRRDARRKLKL